jgi:oligopeptidase B
MPAAFAVLLLAMLLPSDHPHRHAAEPLTPPVAEKRPKAVTKFGDRRVDDYFWLREKESPEVIDYLEAENRYTEEVMKPLEGFRDRSTRRCSRASRRPTRACRTASHGYWYYQREVEGLQYPIYCRRKGTWKRPRKSCST